MTLALIGLLLLPVSCIWSGYALSVLWGWFLVPTLGLPPLGIAASIGLALVVTYLTHQTIHDPRDGEEKLVEAIMSMILKPAFALGFGWIVKAFM